MDYKHLMTSELSSKNSKLLMTKPIERVCKRMDICVQARELGNEAFRASGHNADLHEKILHCYSASLAFAPSDSEHLALTYGNKSALLLHLRKFDDCVKDIDRALKLPVITNALRIKLLCRKLECFVAMGKLEGRMEILKEIDEDLAKADDKKKPLEKMVLRIKALMAKGQTEVAISEDCETEHLRVRTLKESKGIFDSINLIHNAKYGHHLVASQDIQPGQIIFISKSYTAVASFKQFQSYCAHCVNVLWSSVPCQNCGFSLYCSEKCRDEAMNSYHDIECHCLQFILCDNLVDYQIHLALRSVIMAVKEFGSIDALIQVVQDVDNLPNEDGAKGFDSDGKFHSDSFRSLLKFTDTAVGTQVLQCLVEGSCRSVIALARYTSFFGISQQFKKIKDLLDNPQVIFVASLLLRISLIAFKKGKKITEKNTPCKNSMDRVSCSSSLPCCERGYSIDMMSSFLPHSCNPNVKSVLIEGGKELWYALQPIAKGQVLFDCCKVTFFELEKSQRSPINAQIINRDCNCVACEKNWPAVLVSGGRFMSNQDMSHIIAENLKKKNVSEKFLSIGENERYTQATIEESIKIMNVAFEIENQPSKLLCSMIHTLCFVFDSLHGIKLCMPSGCRMLPT